MLGICRNLAARSRPPEGTARGVLAAVRQRRWRRRWPTPPGRRDLLRGHSSGGLPDPAAATVARRRAAGLWRGTQRRRDRRAARHQRGQRPRPPAPRAAGAANLHVETYLLGGPRMSARPSHCCASTTTSPATCRKRKRGVRGGAVRGRRLGRRRARRRLQDQRARGGRRFSGSSGATGVQSERAGGVRRRIYARTGRRAARVTVAGSLRRPRRGRRVGVSRLGRRREVRDRPTGRRSARLAGRRHRGDHRRRPTPGQDVPGRAPCAPEDGALYAICHAPLAHLAFARGRSISRVVATRDGDAGNGRRVRSSAGDRLSRRVRARCTSAAGRRRPSRCCSCTGGTSRCRSRCRTSR